MSASKLPPIPPGRQQDEEDDEAEHFLTTTEEDDEELTDLPLGGDGDEEEVTGYDGGDDGGEEDDDDDEEPGAYEDFPRNAGPGSEEQGAYDTTTDDDAKTEGEGATSTAGESEGGDSDWVKFLKKPPQSMDDFMEDPDMDMDDDDLVAKSSSIDILELTNLTQQEAASIAEVIIEMLEEDLEAYQLKTGINFPEPLTKAEKKRLKYGLTDKDSASSFNSDLSELLPGEPSKIRMTYEKGVSVYHDLSLMHLQMEERVDKEVQVNLHRPKKKTPVKHYSRYTQTYEMTFVSGEMASLIYKQLYPQMDDFREKAPPSRRGSEEICMRKAEAEDKNIDTRRKGPQIISLSNKKQLLQPLMDDYYKDEQFWTGGRFVGEYRKRQFYKGIYYHGTGAQIESEFENGHFESKKHTGLVSYPRGDTFEGEWVKGRYQNGQITFSDGLKFAATDWRYCEPPDRRFKVERYYGIKPAGLTLFSDQCPAPNVPPGTYDVGDGFFNPRTGDVRGYDGFLLRQASRDEKNWIERNCRKVHETMEHVEPKFLMERIPGSYVECEKRIPLTKKRFH